MLPAKVQFQLDATEARLLTEIGFIASGMADVVRAECIFGALMLARPDGAFPHIGLAAALLNAGQPDEAAFRLSKVHLPEGADADMVQAFRGLALQLDQRPTEATRVLRAVAGSADNQPTSEGARLARRLLGHHDNGSTSQGVATVPIDMEH